MLSFVEYIQQMFATLDVFIFELWCSNIYYLNYPVNRREATEGTEPNKIVAFIIFYFSCFISYFFVKLKCTSLSGREPRPTKGSLRGECDLRLEDSNPATM